MLKLETKTYFWSLWSLASIFAMSEECIASIRSFSFHLSTISIKQHYLISYYFLSK